MDKAYIIQILFSFSVLIVILFVLTQVSKRIQSKRFSGELIVKDRVSLSQQNSLVLLEFKGDSYLLGVSPKEISLIEKRQ